MPTATVSLCTIKCAGDGYNSWQKRQFSWHNITKVIFEIDRSYSYSTKFFRWSYNNFPKRNIWTFITVFWKVQEKFSKRQNKRLTMITELIKEGEPLFSQTMINLYSDMIPGFSGSLILTTTSLAGANLEAADRKDPCFLLATSDLGLVFSLRIWDLK